MAEQALRQGADERLRSQCRRPLPWHMGEGVLPGCAGTEAREEERHQPVESGICGDVGRGEVVRVADLTNARPVLAEQGTMSRPLIDMAWRPSTHPVRRGEQQRRSA